MAPRPSRCEKSCDCDNSCGNVPASELKCCSACKKVWYCSKKCQKADWPRHIFVCKLDRPIPTAYYLSQACREGLPPVHSQTREDFGFAKAESLLPASVQGDLLRMWTVVYDFAKVSDRDIQAWQAKGALVEGIKTTLTRLPKSDLRDACYAWFLDHLDLLDGSPVDKAQANEFGTRSFEEATRTAWIKAGGSPDDDFKTIRVKIKALPCHVQECHDFYALVAHRVHPRPEFSSWLVFGFVAGMDREDEYWIGRWYARLVNRCTFDAFAAAYQTSSLIKLGEEHEVNLPCPLSSYAKSFFRDVMTASPREFKTVWYLKQYIDQLRVVDPSEPPVLANRGTRADYGFANCRDALEQKLLDELYTNYFAHPDANPLDLHKACVAGALAEYVGGLVRLKPKTKTYKRLLKNGHSASLAGELEGLTISNSRALVLRH